MHLRGALPQGVLPAPNQQWPRGRAGDAIMRMEANISSVLRQDSECISAVHCLKVFCQRLGCDLSSGEAVRRVAGCAFALATEALSDLAVLQFPPSLTAAAVLVAARRAQARPPAYPDPDILIIPASLTAAAVLVAAQRAQARPSALPGFICQVGAPARLPDLCCFLTLSPQAQAALLHIQSRLRCVIVDMNIRTSNAVCVQAAPLLSGADSWAGDGAARARCHSGRPC